MGGQEGSWLLCIRRAHPSPLTARGATDGKASAPSVQSTTLFVLLYDNRKKKKCCNASLPAYVRQLYPPVETIRHNITSHPVVSPLGLSLVENCLMLLQSTAQHVLGWDQNTVESNQATLTIRCENKIRPMDLPGRTQRARECPCICPFPLSVQKRVLTTEP